MYNSCLSSNPISSGTYLTKVRAECSRKDIEVGRGEEVTSDPYLVENIRGQKLQLR